MYTAQEIAFLIKQTAKIKNLTLKQLLENCDLSINTISELSKGKQISYISFSKIADCLNCSVDYLLGRTDNPEMHIKDSSLQVHDITNSGTRAIGNNVTLKNIKDPEQLKTDITDQEYELIKILREMPLVDKFECLQFIVNMYKKGE